MDPEYTFRFIIIGDSGVGKTCLLKRFETDTYDPYSPNTIGIEYIRKIIEIDCKKISI